MASHGTQRRYVEGCRCDDCKEAHRISARDYSERRASGQTRPAAVHEYATSVVSTPTYEPGPVESGVEAEIVGLAELRPGLAQVALALAKILDNPRAVNQQPAAAKVLVTVAFSHHDASPKGRVTKSPIGPRAYPGREGR
jgi:hypothetical protein